MYDIKAFTLLIARLSMPKTATASRFALKSILHNTSRGKINPDQ